MLPIFHQSPTEDAFVQNPYPAYARAQAMGPMVWWEDYGMPAAVSHAAVMALLRDDHFGREPPEELRPEIPPHLAPFYALEANSMLELEPPRHTRLRGLVLRAFTTGQIAALAPEIRARTEALIAAFPQDRPFDLLEAFARPLPVQIIAQLLGVPVERAADLLAWSNAMVKMYQAGRTSEDEVAAVVATEAFVAWLEEVFAARRQSPGRDLLSLLLEVEAEGERLSHGELLSTVILILNAGHEATVHTLGNGIHTLLRQGLGGTTQTADPSALVDEVLRHDPPLHIFTRWCYRPCTRRGHDFARGDQVALVLGAANRDPDVYLEPEFFDPARADPTHTSFGAGIHFCLGAPLARLELSIALPALFAAHPKLRLVAPPRYAPIYHFHGLEALQVAIE